MTPRPYTPRDPEWHDHTVAAAANAWLNEPRDTEAYRRLIEAVLRRRAFLEPTLDEVPEDPCRDEVLDEIGADRAPQRLRDNLVEVMRRLQPPPAAESSSPPQDPAGDATSPAR